MKFRIIMFLLFFSAFKTFAQESAAHQAAAKRFREVAQKTKCPERARVLILYAEHEEDVVRALAGQNPLYPGLTLPPVPDCEGDLMGAGNGNAAGSSSSKAGTGQMPNGINNIGVLGNAAQALGPSAKFGIGGDITAGSLSGDLGILFTKGIGVSGKLEIPISKTLNFAISDFEEILDVGIAAQNYHNLSPSYTFSIPKLGLKYFISDPFYFEGEIGDAICSSTDFKGGLAFSIGLGLDFSVFELGSRYESWGNNSEITQIAVHLGIRF